MAVSLRGDRLATLPGIVLGDIRYRQRPGSWSDEMPEAAHGVCLVRSGWFRRQSEGQQEVVDATSGYIARMGAEERIAGSGAQFTWIELSPEAYESHIAPAVRDRSWLLRTTPIVHLRHWSTFVAAQRGTDDFELLERLLTLFEALPSRPVWDSSRSRYETWTAHRRLAAAVQEALNCHLLLSLDELAALVGSSPHHLSRVFRAVTGRTITNYRNELRVRSVLEHLSNGAGLADLAAAHGFFDHGHMTRVIRRHVGLTPSALRQELSTKVQAKAEPGEQN